MNNENETPDQDILDPEVYKLSQAVENGSNSYEPPPIETELEDMPASSLLIEQSKTAMYFKPERKKPIPYAISYNQLVSILNERWDTWGIEDEQFRYFCMASYLFCGRIKETLQLRKGEDIQNTSFQDRKFIEVSLLNQKRKGRFIFKDGLKKQFLYKQQADGSYLKLRPDPKVADFVKPPPTRRSIALPIESVGGKDLIEKEMLNEFINDYLPQFDDGQYIFNFGSGGDDKRNLDAERIKCWHALHKIDFGPVRVTRFNDQLGRYEEGKKVESYPGYPHYLRHVRLTHLRRHYGFDIYALQKFVGWIDPKMAENYVHMESKDIASAFIAGLPNSDWKSGR